MPPDKDNCYIRYCKCEVHDYTYRATIAPPRINILEEVRIFVNSLDETPPHEPCACCNISRSGECYTFPCMPRDVKAYTHCCNKTCHPERWVNNG